MSERRQFGLARLTLGCAAMAVLVGGCSATSPKQNADVPGSAGASTPDGNGSSSGNALDDQASAKAKQVLAMGQADRDAALAKAGLDLELAVAQESGLATELGGADAARAALATAWTPLVAQAAAVNAGDLPTGFRKAAPAVPALGDGFFGGYLIGALTADSAVSAGNSGHTGPPESDTTSGFTVTRSGSLNRGEVTTEGTHVDSATGVTTKLVNKTSSVPCPDADGRFEIEAVIDVTVSKGTAGQHGILDVKVVGHVDDDAHLASSEMDYTMKWSRGSGGAAELVDLSVSRSGASTTIKHTGGSATSTLEASATAGGQIYAYSMEHFLLAAAQRGWESGNCVRLDVTSEPAAKDVKPGGTAEIKAAPRSTIDGGKVGGNVIATFAGKLTVEPNGSPVPADAGFVYTAPTEGLPTSGTVKLEARSRRGVGKAEIVFQIGRITYIATGTGSEITFSGSVSDPDSFVLSGDFQGGSATFDFESDIDAEGNRLPTGVVKITGGGSEAKVTGDGTYTLVANQDGTLTLTMKTHSCVDVSGQCRDSTDEITLTPKS